MKKFLSYTFVLCCFAAVSLCSSCKKDSNEATKPYMEGEVQFEFPEFVGELKDVTVTASGITKPADVTYKWVSSSMFSDTLVGTTVTVCTPDTLGDFAIIGYAFADGYYASYTTRTFTTVDPERSGSIEGLPAASGSFKDERDEKTYDVITVGSLQWFAQNLAWEGAGRSYHDSPIMDGLVGRFYTWNEATGGKSGSGIAGGPQGVCPKGWNIPTREDWEDLATAVTGAEQRFSEDFGDAGDLLSVKTTFNKNEMWQHSYENIHSNKVGWNAMPMGFCSEPQGFSKYGRYAFFWSSYCDSDKAYYRYIHYNSKTMPSSFTSKDGWYASVRCVRVKQ